MDASSNPHANFELEASEQAADGFTLAIQNPAHSFGDVHESPEIRAKSGRH
jgi:helix-turn-helix protein